jgi:DNA-binding CsgD family transcriptional regulator
VRLRWPVNLAGAVLTKLGAKGRVEIVAEALRQGVSA